ncbi:MAG: DNA methyltransferase [Leptolyngbya foveolarum]|uniref:Site-specific DNA-methyltransferase (adenine-specific) n=1 Tax=Leptolyngbya foveolarum TaxID=47253 RepID=A0A2W4VUW5_9CYAN|nr:MAG: DNA methyltransferase [Leptolyngbya foveolarum]
MSLLPTYPLTQIVQARPFIKWAGGKSRLLAQYKPFLPTDFERYHEPFLGGGALFFYLAPQLQAQEKRAYLSDLNPELVNVYRCVRDEVEGLIEQLAVHKELHGETHYYEVRSRLQTEPIARAARFIYLNKTCYNGLYRENSRGLFNVPMGRYKDPKICVPDLLRAASSALQIADISERPFLTVLDHAKNADDFVYFDPPYHPLSETSKFTAYSRDRFTAEQQTALKNAISQLATRQVKVLASNSDCPFIRELYEGFEIKTINAARSINSKASKRGKITEVLVIA